MNYRIFVEKKGIFDVESPKIFDEIKEILPQITSVKVYNVYDIFGLEEKDLNKVANSTFVDPVTDILHLENPVQNIFLATEFYLASMIREQIQRSSVSLSLRMQKMQL